MKESFAMRTYPCLPIPGDESDPQSLCQLLRRYLQWLETHNFAANTVKVRRLQLSRFIRWCDDRSVTRAAEVTAEMIERFQRHLFYYRQKNGQPLSISSQSHWLISLRSWFAWLKDQRVLEQNPALELQLPREEKRLPRHALSESEVEAIMAQADLSKPSGLRTRAILEVLYSSGLRRQEVLSLHLTDLDRQRRVILVRQGKGNKDRYVPLGARALAWIDKYLAEARPRLLGDQETASPLLFVTGRGRQVHANQLSSQVRQFMNQAGITKGGACHLFRHTAATLTQVREFGRSVKDLRAIWGCLFHYIWTRSSKRRRRRGSVRPRRWRSTAWAASGSVTHRNVTCRRGPPPRARARRVTSPLFNFASSSSTVRGASPNPAWCIQPASVFHNT
jgi:integrase/recombinase XerD